VRQNLRYKVDGTLYYIDIYLGKEYLNVNTMNSKHVLHHFIHSKSLYGYGNSSIAVTVKNQYKQKLSLNIKEMEALKDLIIHQERKKQNSEEMLENKSYEEKYDSVFRVTMYVEKRQ